MTKSLGDNDSQPQLQRDVQRLLGRCLLRIQQYEVLLKAMLARHELAGPVETLNAQRAVLAEKLSDKSLGTLVKTLFDTYVVPTGFERELLPDDKTPTDRTSMAFSSRLEMTPENRSKTKDAVDELVDLRNQLVHHLIEQFDLWSAHGCVDAINHLLESYDRIDRHCLGLSAWAKTMDEARSKATAIAQSAEFLDMVVDGVLPDGSFEWPHTGIVRVLREASKELALDGWTTLDSARNWIGDKHPEQVPQKYGCRTWPQVLSESGQFELQYRSENGGTKKAWFRERQTSI